MPHRLPRLAALAAAALVCGLPAALAPAPAQAQSYCPPTIRVQPGDTAFGIARRCGVPPEVLVDSNPRVNFDRLQAGQTLAIPRPIDGGGYTPQPPAPPMPPPPREPPPPRGGYAGRAAVSIDRAPIEPGGVATLRVSGFLPRETVIVTAGPAQGRRLKQFEGRLPNGRAAVIELDIPGRARPGERWVVEAEGNRGSYASAEFRVEAPGYGGGIGGEEEITVSGVLTNEGAECPTLRARNGVYSLAGRLGRFRPGDIVTVTGVLSDVSICQQGETIEVDEIRPAR